MTLDDVCSLQCVPRNTNPILGSSAKQVNLNIAPRKGFKLVFLPFAIDKIYMWHHNDLLSLLIMFTLINTIMHKISRKDHNLAISKHF